MNTHMNRPGTGTVTANLARVLKALGDTNRLNIVMSIGRKTRSVSEIVKVTGLSQTLVSFHLRALREADIVITKRTGPFIYYSLSEPLLLDLLNSISHATNSKGCAQDKTLVPGASDEKGRKRE